MSTQCQRNARLFTLLFDLKIGTLVIPAMERVHTNFAFSMFFVHFYFFWVRTPYRRDRWARPVLQSSTAAQI